MLGVEPLSSKPSPEADGEDREEQAESAGGTKRDADAATSADSCKKIRLEQ